MQSNDKQLVYPPILYHLKTYDIYFLHCSYCLSLEFFFSPLRGEKHQLFIRPNYICSNTPKSERTRTTLTFVVFCENFCPPSTNVIEVFLKQHKLKQKGAYILSLGKKYIQPKISINIQPIIYAIIDRDLCHFMNGDSELFNLVVLMTEDLLCK